MVDAREGEDLTSYIADASLLVDETLGVTAPSGLSEDRMKLIEKYLAAHLWVIAQEKGGLTGEKMGDASATYQKADGRGLSSTRFGQMVVNLDTTGKLDKVLSNVKKAQFRVV